MDWEKPEFVEISLACEVSSYANAQLNDELRGQPPQPRPEEQ